MKPVHVLGFVAAAGLVTVGVLAYRQRRRKTLGLADGEQKPFVTNIEKATLKNNNYRKVLATSPHSQLVLMAIAPNGDIGEEVHLDTDQFIRIERGKGKAVIAGRRYTLHDGVAVTIPAGTRHNIINTGDEPMKLYTVYSPAHHSPGTVNVTYTTQLHLLLDRT